MKDYEKCPICKKDTTEIGDRLGKTIVCLDRKCPWRGIRIENKANKDDRKNRKY